MSTQSTRTQVAGLQVRVYAILLTFLLPFGFASAQQFGRFAPQQTADALKSLSTQSQAVIERLSKFGSLPIEDWRYHAGEVQNGQANALDDSSWQVIQTPYRTNTTDVVWLRKTIEVPKTLDGYDLTGSRISIQSWGRSNLTVYFNGRRVAEGEHMEPFVLFDSATPGDKVLVAVRIGKTEGPKTLPASHMHIDFASNRPNPKDMYAEFVSAALLVPSLSENVPASKATLEKAIGDVNLKDLDADHQKEFDDSLRKAQADLAPLRATLQQATFHLTGNSHIDAAWLWPWTETVDVVRRTFGTALQLMDEYPTYTYTQSAAQYNQWMADKYPEMNAQIKQRIKEGRWEVVGGMWVEPDLNMPDGESQVRELLIGKRTFKQLYGVDVRIGWNPDSFGYNWQLPQIYKKSGIDYFVTQKMSWNDTNQLPLKLFWWESPDGSKVLTYFPNGYGNRSLNPVRLSNDLVKARTLAPGMLEMMDLYGVGDHGGGPTRTVLDEGLHWMQPDKVVPQMKFGIAQAFFSDVETKIAADSPTWNYASMAKGNIALPPPPASKITIPTWKDELYLEYHRGVYTTQAHHKRNMRESEEWVLNAEKYSSLAWLDGQTYPAHELTEAWKKVVFNQFHDLAAGSGIGVIYQDAQQDYNRVRWATNEASAQALQTLQSHINTRAAGAVPILVFNPLGWKRSGMVNVSVEMPNAVPGGVSVLDAQNRVLPSEILSSDDQTNTLHLMIELNDVPSLGYQVLHVVAGKRPFANDLIARGMTLENAKLKVTVDPHTGCITSLYDKRANFETLAPNSCGNELIAFEDKPKAFDAWNLNPNYEKTSTKLDMADSVQLVEKGPLRAVIRVTRTWQSSKFVQDITLCSGSDEVNVVNDIDWHETHILLKAAFTLAASSDMATYEIPYGTIQRPTTRNNSWEKAKFEVSALRWADLGDGRHGFSLINESKYGYNTYGNVMRLSLLRATISPDPNADRGHHHFSYALYPHDGDWKTALTVRHGYEYNYPLNAEQVEAHTGTMPLEHSFIAVQPSNVVLTAVKKAEDSNGLIIRFYEWAGKTGVVTLHLPQGATSAELTDLMEHPEGPSMAVRADSVSIPVRPFQIVTVRADYPKRDR